MADVPTPEAIVIPKLNPLLRDLARAPYLETGAAAASKTIYDELNEGTCSKIYIQNCSTATVFISYSTPATPDRFALILAGGTAQDDGLGAYLTLDIRERGIKKLNVYSASTLRLSIQKFARNQVAGLI